MRGRSRRGRCWSCPSSHNGLMAKSAAELRADAERIWRAGVAGVMPELLVREHVQVEDNWLVVGDEAIDLNQIERIAIVGGGKAAGAMAASLEGVLGQKLLHGKDV